MVYIEQLTNSHMARILECKTMFIIYDVKNNKLILKKIKHVTKPVL